jgi:hypothetical protein
METRFRNGSIQTDFRAIIEAVPGEESESYERSVDEEDFEGTAADPVGEVRPSRSLAVTIPR